MYCSGSANDVESDVALKYACQPSSSALYIKRRRYSLIAGWLVREAFDIYLNPNDNVVILLSSCYKLSTKYSCYVVTTILITKDSKLPSKIINNQVLHSFSIHRLTHILGAHSDSDPP